MSDKCLGCGTENCSIQSLHEAVFKSIPEVDVKAKLRREVLKRHNIQLPPSIGMGEKDHLIVDSIVNAILNLEDQVEKLRNPLNPPQEPT